jgi:hypothetical protein
MVTKTCTEQDDAFDAALAAAIVGIGGIREQAGRWPPNRLLL